jgi:Family of unknown function (DUF6364)
MSKLTLSVDEQVISRAKEYAKLHGMSISAMVETYLDAVAAPQSSYTSLDTPILNSLIGIAKGANIEDYYNYLEQKYR